MEIASQLAQYALASNHDVASHYTAITDDQLFTQPCFFVSMDGFFAASYLMLRFYFLGNPSVTRLLNMLIFTNETEQLLFQLQKSVFIVPDASCLAGFLQPPDWFSPGWMCESLIAIQPLA